MSLPRSSLIAPVCFGLFLILAFVSAVTSWLLYVPIDTTAQAPASVVFDRGSQVVAHQTGGRITDVLVEDGQIVRQGALLLRLDRRKEELAQATERENLARLEAESARLALMLKNGTEKAELSFDQSQLLEAEQNRRAAALTVFDEEAIKTQSALLATQTQQAFVADQQSLLLTKITRTKALVAKGLATKQSLDDLLSSDIALKGEAESLAAKAIEIGASLSALKAQKQSQLTTWRLEDQLAYKANLDQRQKTQASLEQLALAISNGEIRAANDGIVSDLVANFSGQIFSPSEKMLQLVSPEPHIWLEVKLAPGFVDDVAIGQTARLVFTTLGEMGNPPEAKATISLVEADQTQDEQGNSYYRLKLEFMPDDLGLQAIKPSLRSSTPAMALFDLDRRSLGQELMDSFAKAMLSFNKA